jgi:hypothetical protein
MSAVFFAEELARLEQAVSDNPIGAAAVAEIAELSGRLCRNGVQVQDIIELLRSWLRVVTSEVPRA